MALSYWIRFESYTAIRIWSKSNISNPFLSEPPPNQAIAKSNTSFPMQAKRPTHPPGMDLPFLSPASPLRLIPIHGPVRKILPMMKRRGNWVGLIYMHLMKATMEDLPPTFRIFLRILMKGIWDWLRSVQVRILYSPLQYVWIFSFHWMQCGAELEFHCDRNQSSRHYTIYNIA